MQTGLMKQVIVGLGSLATGVFAMTAIGMTLLGARVLVGVLAGELDPSAAAGQVTMPNSSSSTSDNSERSALERASADWLADLRRRGGDANGTAAQANPIATADPKDPESMVKSADELLRQAQADIAAALQRAKDTSNSP